MKLQTAGPKRINGSLLSGLGKYEAEKNSGKSRAWNLYAKTKAKCQEKPAGLLRDMKAEIAAGKKQGKQEEDLVS